MSKARQALRLRAEVEAQVPRTAMVMAAGLGKRMEPGEFLAHAYANFTDAAGKWLTGNEPFTAKLNPAYAPYGEYDQLMRLEEWYGRK